MTKRGQCHIIWVSQKGPDGSCSGLGVCGQVLTALNKGFAMISVTMFATVVGRSKSKRRNFEVAYQEGMTALDIARSEFSNNDLESLMVMVNGKHVPLETVLADGDNVALALVISGG